MSSTDIKVYNPITSFFYFLNAVEFEGVNNALVLRPWDFIKKLRFLETVHSLWLLLLDCAALGVLEKDSWWAICEDTLKEMHFITFLILMMVFAI